MMFRTFFTLTVVGGLALWSQAGSEPLAGWIARGQALVSQARADAARHGGALVAMLPGGAGAGAAIAATAGAGGPPAATARGGAPDTAAGGPRKCMQQGKVLYTTQACPPGSVEQGVAGAVSVVPDSREAVASARAAMAPDAASGPAGAVGIRDDRKAAAPKNPLREKLLGPDDPDMRARAIDRAIGD